MLRIKMIVVDRTRAPFLREGETLFQDRIRRYARLEWIEVRPVRITKGRPEADVLELEGREILRRVRPADYSVALDRCGKVFDSEELARWLDRLSSEVRGSICFITGSPLGLSREILERSNMTLSLSRLTFTHEMTRLLLLEQIYRALTIIRGEKYHK
ncbi:MAG: 23S rRNA (pseudouridine(1915)-N(3))-methyltransferase RlmH [Deltaproteobacteria bacterium]|nr:23S rRNA (pseudouridine(1915)-N(3))-methyltransferase RlmH [Deltaproteobacteria bacterium]MBW2129832.1 23S rRNA (pseudouridine(1915)-N(3))-methyltransferase RlmH [Deltaproteobacteria bacterium]MBW2305010.1 23S rRNA (pseudouridine(1915)-N(3))-methyltransferase RlmH [Deltaproteobacteria bacterium]